MSTIFRGGPLGGIRVKVDRDTADGELLGWCAMTHDGAMQVLYRRSGGASWVFEGYAGVSDDWCRMVERVGPQSRHAGVLRSRDQMGPPRRYRLPVYLLMLAALFGVPGPQPVHATVIRMAAWNVANNPDDAGEDAAFTTVLGAIGHIDLLAVAETDTGSSVRLVGLLDAAYGGDGYEMVTSSSIGGDRTALLYDTGTVDLIDAVDLTTLGTHPVVRGQFRATGAGAFYIYSIHLKSGSASSDKARRATEAANLRADADALGEGAQIIYAGDFNLHGSTEAAWEHLVAPGPGQAVDLAEAPGVWRDNTEFLALHTQNPQANMDDRFDLQLVSGELVDGLGLDYVLGSFQVFGNDGTHMLGAAIDTGTGADPAVLEALMLASDHLPVVADYRVVPEPTVGGLLLISSLGLLRRRLLGRARREVPSQSQPCSIPALTGPGSDVILSATGSEPGSGPLGFNEPAKRADRIFQLVNTTDTESQMSVEQPPSSGGLTETHLESNFLSVR